ncbi:MULTISPECIES: hypothetical protein [unclassified Pseudomonas]|uniref:hypothetical protein n=1 Tax=unclassified Pseudomonas TaxID=196821 RepID=UPI000BC5D985|nr:MULTISPECIES: hypothetical protein [unclassified Pseudomonas]PVZ19941.1 hypothetical protein F474_00532 [Pseudomonas sp. URIL14HWK12:I12]PVZ27007.1 hypothetical protein F470_00187 [Pseudomonas sp. URIL14HWK12:I10]PVZ37896.1 hypothetical protein F472_00532 [Pseudomonas sp. URIL14HWK12:I11]SNZ05234.1 hypothetical protein SAMN05660463_00872 [Pseudomonas sp. URIL14HWK12:I9]
MIYTSVLAAVVSALAAEAIDNTSKQAWQKLYSPHNEGKVDISALGGRRSGDLSRADADCWVHARLHSQLIPRHWDVLMAKYTTHKGRKVESIGRLVPLIASAAPRLFRYKAVTAWAIPPLKGNKDGKRSTDMIVLPAEFYDINTWDAQGLNRTTYWRWKKAIEEVLEEMVDEALKASEHILMAEGVLIAEVA